jgi:hypothetical protein
MTDDNVVYPSSPDDENVDALTEIRPSRSAGRRSLVAYHPSAARYSTLPTTIFARGPHGFGPVRSFDNPTRHVAASGAEVLPVISFYRETIVGPKGG